jgi:hypothetical protein
MITGLDEYPIHQLPQPMVDVGSSDRNFYDRWYFNAHDRSGDIFAIFGAGYYPNLGTKDAFVLIRRGDEQTAVHLSDAMDHDRLNPRIGNFRIEVTKPLEEVRVVLEDTEGIAMDLHWRGLFPAIQEAPHVMRTGTLRKVLDAQRFAQCGSWEGTMSIDGEEVAVTPDRWIGSRDRSWGIRPSGESEPAGRPADPAWGGMWWLYVPVAFDDFGVCLIIQEEADGYRLLNDCTRIFKDGRIEQLGWPRIETAYTSGTRTPTNGVVTCTLPDGAPVRLELESLLPVPIHVGGGYGGDPDWGHGRWNGPGFTERRTYDMTAPAVVGLVPFGLTDSVGRAVWQEEGRKPQEGWGLYEHGVLGLHEPSGFTDWFTHAP